MNDPPTNVVSNKSFAPFWANLQERLLQVRAAPRNGDRDDGSNEFGRPGLEGWADSNSDTKKDSENEMVGLLALGDSDDSHDREEQGSQGDYYCTLESDSGDDRT